MRKYDDTAVKELIKTVQCGNDEESNAAQKELYEDNTGLIRSVVKRYLNRGTDSEDLFQIGSIGLIKAIRTVAAKNATASSENGTFFFSVIIGKRLLLIFLRIAKIIGIEIKESATSARMYTLENSASPEYRSHNTEIALLTA